MPKNENLSQKEAGAPRRSVGFTLTIVIVVGVLLLMMLAIGACAPAEPEVVIKKETVIVTESVEKIVVATPVPPPPPPPQAEFVAAWESGAHGDTYGLGKGPNTYCSRCHSPQNWDPESKPGRPPNCIACKFPTDEEVRQVDSMDFVPEEDWVGIGCDTCHELDEDGATSGELAWFNKVADGYEAVNTPTELCEKCHVTTSGIMVTGGTGVTHGITLGGSAHVNWAGEWPQSERPQYCTDCHDPHSAEPLTCVDCHENVLTLDTHMKGNNAVMLDKVECMACHDADEMEVGPHPDEEMNGVFTTLVSAVGRAGPTIDYVKSHSIQWQVSCDRCHSEDNAWGLSVKTAAGDVPEA